MAEARIVRSAEGDVYEDLWLFKQGSLTGGRFDFMVGNIGYPDSPANRAWGPPDARIWPPGMLLV